MASKGGRTTTSLIKRLTVEPFRFEFFQAVRLLRAHLAHGQRSGSDTPAAAPDGAPPDDDELRFAVPPSSTFAAAAVQAIRSVAPRTGSNRRYELLVNFLGLTGPTGVLPRHFTSLLIERQRANDPGLLAFQDIFNHRLVSLFYRAWEKYRADIGYERCRQRGAPLAADPFALAVLSLVGFGTAGLLQRQALPPETLIRYSGALAHFPRNAANLRLVLGDFLGMPVEIEQFVGKWVSLHPADQSRLPTSRNRRGQNGVVGLNLLVGEQVYEAGSRVCIWIGPLYQRAYSSLLPSGGMLTALTELARTCLGLEFDVEIQLVLLASEAPAAEIGDAGARLGWTSFVRSEPLHEDARGARFAVNDIQSCEACS